MTIHSKNISAILCRVHSKNISLKKYNTLKKTQYTQKILQLYCGDINKMKTHKNTTLLGQFSNSIDMF